MRAIVVGTGAGGAAAARELASRGFEVAILEAGREFRPCTRNLGWAKPLRGMGLLGGERTISRIFPAMEARRSSEDLVLVRGLATGGCTAVSCGNLVRADNGLREIGLDLSPEFDELERLVGVSAIPRERWRPLTGRMFDAAAKLGLAPQPTPKAVDVERCVSCGLCELGCATGARWDSRRFLAEALRRGAKLRTGMPVRKVLVETGAARGVLAGPERLPEKIYGDVVVLAAGAIGDARILKASGLPAEDRLWADVVLTVGGLSRGARMLEEPPMVWYARRDGYILSPYLDVLSHWFHGPWRSVPVENRVGMMVKLADEPNGAVSADGRVTKSVTSADRERLDAAVDEARRIMEAAGVEGPFVRGMLNGGHFGGTVPLSRDDVATMHPSILPPGLWVADLALAPKSQGMPTMLVAAALGLRVARGIPGK
ncbi:MAG: GMC family oxidoreductase [Candidatus Latescibacterota bacterium]|jgi:choline dehydrogenase-like flavoprotein|nr:MAG: GMC family oxidoreductase [Candidatus Latescibacterota bacterium]